ncbi:restriction endonuclease subunit S [Bacteroides fragilis]|nr:restriction endonuclease subunit S [Bacteroides fragilis]
MGGGGAQPNISKEKIINTYIPLPPFAEQKKNCKCCQRVVYQIRYYNGEFIGSPL